MAEQLHVGAVNATITFTIKSGGSAVDISSRTDIEVTVVAPNGARTTPTVSNVTDGSNGQVKWVTSAAADLHTPGKWLAQAWVEFSSGTTAWFTDVGTFTVERNL